jgi:hypothetical protein
MDTELLAQILDELREIGKDLRWFKEREERQQRAALEAIEDISRPGWRVAGKTLV